MQACHDASLHNTPQIYNFILMKKIGILLIVLGFSTLMTAAENKISGQVLDSEQQPIAYATVSLLTSDSALITGTITNENGEFSITAPASARIVQVSFVGYETYANTLNISEKNLKITLNEEATALAEVEVSGKRPLIERQFDKIVLNVASSPFSTGFSSKELLKKAPGVNVDKDGNVTVNGKSVSIYIDGRPSDLSGDQLKAMLDGMYSAPTVSGYYRSSDSYYLSASIRKMWKEKGLIFTLDAQDLLRSMKDKKHGDKSARRLCVAKQLDWALSARGRVGYVDVRSATIRETTQSRHHRRGFAHVERKMMSWRKIIFRS